MTNIERGFDNVYWSLWHRICTQKSGAKIITWNLLIFGAIMLDILFELFFSFRNRARKDRSGRHRSFDYPYSHSITIMGGQIALVALAFWIDKNPRIGTFSFYY